MSKKDKGRLPQFVPLLHATLDCPAWRATSHGARSVYVALKRRVPRERNVAWVSYKDAIAELKSSKRKIADWFRELQHYGLIVLHSQGCLGADGKGQSPHWRLTELGKTPHSSSDGLPEPPTRDFLNWDGETFFKPRDPGRKWEEREELVRKKQNPGSDVGTRVVPTWEPPPVPTWDTGQLESGSDGVDIRNGEGGSDVGDITSLTTTSDSGAPAPTSVPAPSEGLLEEENNLAPTNVVPFDERIATLEASEKKRSLRRGPQRRRGRRSF